MKVNIKKFSAGLLSLTVVGGAAGLLTMSLAGTRPLPPAVTRSNPVIEQTAIETIVVYGHRPANHAGLVTPHKHNSTAGIRYADGRSRESNPVVVK